MNCSSCYKSLKDGANFCTYCGAKQPDTQTNEKGNIAKKELVQQDYRTNLVRFKSTAIGFAAVIILSFLGYYGHNRLLGEDIAYVKKPVLENSEATIKVQSWIKSLGLDFIEQGSCFVTRFNSQNGIKNYCEKLTEVKQFNEGSYSYVYATIAGIALNEDNSHADAHVDSGVVEFIKFVLQGGELTPINTSGEIYSGSFGNPGNTKILELGKNNLIGWQVQDGYAGMGEETLYISLYAVIDQSNGGIKSILSIQTYFNNAHNCNNDDEKCRLKTISTTIKQEKTQDIYYPLKLSTTITEGTRSNKATSTKEFLVKFDEKTKSYKIPSEYKNIFN